MAATSAPEGYGGSIGGFGGGNIMGMLGGGGGGEMMSMIPQLMRMANVGGGVTAGVTGAGRFRHSDGATHQTRNLRHAGSMLRIAPE